MDDIGNLVYILVFIIWFLYRTFGKSGKKQSRPIPPFNRTSSSDQSTSDPAKPRPAEASRPPVTFEEMLRELTGAPPVTVEKEHDSFEEAPDYYPSPEAEEEEPSFEVLETTGESYKPSPALNPATGKFQEFDVRKSRSSKAVRKALNTFKSRKGVRQAFILKEIFDRKY